MSPDEIQTLVVLFQKAWKEDKQIFLFANGGSTANASPITTDLSKGSSDKLGKRFRVLSLNSNPKWMTATGNDYSFEDVFVRQLANYAKPGNIVFTMSVSGNSPNLVKAIDWSNQNGLTSVALLGKNRGKLAELAHHVLVIDDTHYGRVEDAHMTIGHILCYAFMEQTEARPGRNESLSCERQG